MSITNLPDFEMTQGFSLTGMTGLNPVCIEGFNIENNAMSTHLILTYFPEKGFPLKSMLRFDAHDSYNTDEATLEVFDRVGQHLFVIELSELRLIEVAWAYSSSKVDVIEMKLKYSVELFR